MRSGVVPLWSLLEACRSGSFAEQRQAAVDVERVLRAERSRGFLLHLRLEDSVLLVGGQPAAHSVETFAASHGIAGFLRDAGVLGVEFTTGADAAALLRWAHHIVRGSLPTSWPRGIAVEPLREAVDRGEPVRSVQRQPAVGAQSDSRLRSVFLQHRLIAGLPAIEGVAPVTAKLVVQVVVDRLLQVPAGLEPLMLLQQSEALLQRSTTVAVLTVLLARRVGWPVDRLADLGAAALLHDVGSMLDADEPGPAGFRWLLERGDEDFWLRSALVARRWRDMAPVSPAAGGGPLAAVALVRLAVAVGGSERASLARRCEEAVANGAVPRELADAALGSFAC